MPLVDPLEIADWFTCVAAHEPVRFVNNVQSIMDAFNEAKKVKLTDADDVKFKSAGEDNTTEDAS
ncbi:hypothetical protein HYV43_06415 [Candidatus Micrarchaeota archaeon]|nr:hypothetical protein [Candidatus Micrarchaeota archaeon]